MKLICIGGGPAGLYLSILLKQADPAHEIQIIERNQPGDTFGWGVVFSSETLGHFGDADAETYAEIQRSFRYWDNIDTFYQGTCTTSTGHGFCGLSRRTLLDILTRRAQALGVQVEFGREIVTPAEVDALAAQADVLVACDGINSRVREQHAATFQPRVSMGSARFTWLGSTLPLDAFTFIYRNSEHGLFQVHAYPFEAGLSTFIVECHEDTWRRSGLSEATEAETVAFCERLFADQLRGHRLLGNRSIWRSFPLVECERWHHNNIVLLGDAAHSAHFSIGSGTKLAMEDAIALAAVIREAAQGTAAPALLARYEERRRPDVLRLQRVARVSQSWFESAARYQGQHPLQFTFNQLTRSLRISWDNLHKRDPAFVEQVAAWYQREGGTDAALDPARPTPPPIFKPFEARSVQLQNRVVISPMCMYSAEDGTLTDWHLVHYGSRAIGGPGLLICEMTNVSREGRITPGCAGMYKPEHVVAWRRVVDFVHQHSATKIGVQLAHAGRKAATARPWEGGAPLRGAAAWPILGPSPLAFDARSQVPKEMDVADLARLRDAFARAARMAEEAGFDWLELHMAHGYLLGSFISPLSNRRGDAYGGDIHGRMRFPLEVFDAVRRAWPEHKPISARVSASDWAPGGLSPEDAVAAARLLKAHGCDVIDVSTGGTMPDARPPYGRAYQVPFSDLIRHEAQIATMAVGALTGGDACNTVLAAGRADLCVMARAHLKDPYLMLHEAERYQAEGPPWPPQYQVVAPSRR